MDFLYKTKFFMPIAAAEVNLAEQFTLKPNSISVNPYSEGLCLEIPDANPLTTNRIIIEIQFADVTFSVVVTLENPLDFFIKSTYLLPLQYLDKKIPPGSN